ncbi:MAG: hypothetical protein AB7C98_01040 [Acidithiobacillus sp.]
MFTIPDASKVTCSQCQHFTPDPIDTQGLGRCGKTKLGLPPSSKADDGYLACFPYAARRCALFTAINEQT